MIAFITENITMVLAVALAISEALALVPSFKSSGILDFVIRTLKKLLEKPVN